MSVVITVSVIICVIVSVSGCKRVDQRNCEWSVIVSVRSQSWSQFLAYYDNSERERDRVREPCGVAWL